jgi:hypothetical protein
MQEGADATCDFSHLPAFSKPIERRGRKSKWYGIVTYNDDAKVLGSVFGFPNSFANVSRNPLQLTGITE